MRNNVSTTFLCLVAFAIDLAKRMKVVKRKGHQSYVTYVSNIYKKMLVSPNKICINDVTNLASKQSLLCPFILASNIGKNIRKQFDIMLMQYVYVMSTCIKR